MSRSLDRVLPPLDLHAHIDPTATTAQLSTLAPALVFAVTRTLTEAAKVRSRADPGVIWGCGVHPGLPAAVDEFSADRFHALLPQFLFVGEIGLDRKAGAAARPVLEQIVGLIADEPVLASIHSTGAHSQVLEVLDSGVRGPILHWFTGSALQIERAATAGAFFSVNAAMTDEQIRRLPPERMLPETDFPFTKRGGSALPGDIKGLEERMCALWESDLEAVRRGWYLNLRTLCRQAGVLDRLPEPFLTPVLSA